jgi:hypothetical protein
MRKSFPMYQGLFALVTFLALATAGWNVAQTRAKAALNAGPTLTIPNQVPAQVSQLTTITIAFAPDTASVSSMIFSVDFDTSRLTFNPADTDSNGIPDAITFHTPGAFFTQVTYNAADTDGELDFMVADMSPPLTAIPGGNIVSITFTAGTTTGDTPVLFSADPPVSFGSTAGGSVAGTGVNGSVLISSGPVVTNTPTATATPTRGTPFVYLPLVIRQNTPTPTATPTVTATGVSPTPTATATKTATVTGTPPTPTHTPTKTQVVCSDAIRNGGFENDTDDWDFPATIYTARYTTDQKHTGNRSVQVGLPSPNTYSYSSARQQVVIPANISSATLDVWLYPKSSEAATMSALAAQPSEGVLFGESPLATDIQYVMVLNTSGEVIETLFWDRSNSQTWDKKTFNMKKYAGKTIMIMIGAFNDGVDGVTGMYVDDVVFTICP